MSRRSPSQRFFRELRRRRVPQTVAVYLVAAWAAIEFSDVVVPNLNGPQWVVTAVIVAALVGLPVVLVLAWFFDWDADGLHRTGPEEDEGAPVDGAGSPWLAAVAVLVVSVASAVAVAAVLSAGGGDAPAAATAAETEQEPVEGAERRGVLADRPAPPVPPRGIPDMDSLQQEISRGLEGFGALSELRGLGQLDLKELTAVAERMAEEAGLAVVLSEPEEWKIHSQVPVELAEGERLEVSGVAQDSAGVHAVFVDGEQVAEADDAPQTLRFSHTLTGTGSSGIRVVRFVVATADGREVEREYRIVQVPRRTR